MIDKEEIEETLRDLPNQMNPRKDLASDAEKLAGELYGNQKAHKPRRKTWSIIAAVSVCFSLALVGIIVPIVKSNKVEPPLIYNYTDEELDRSDLKDIQAFIGEHELNIKFFSDAQQTSLFSIKQTSQSAIIAQQYIYIDSSNYDVVQLEVCLTNDTFNRHESYKELQQQKEINGVEVQYKIQEVSGEYTILAKCQVESHWYFWNITSLQGEERIDYYIDFLFGGADHT